MSKITEHMLKIEHQQLLEKKLIHHTSLPHIYGFKWYSWARKLFETRNHWNFLVAANQVSKSSTAIRLCIQWATEDELWLLLWRDKPLQFWYLYPSKDVATIEFQKKWIPQFMPKGIYKDDPKYGWKEEYKNKYIHAVHFNSGVSVYFKTYGQDVGDLQTGSVDLIICDEELPEELYSELNMRIAATEGYFIMIFTATLGQEMWRRTMEEVGTKDELFPDALKLQVSMYDCLFYEDGTPSHWTAEKIERIKNTCKTEAEIQRRVYGRFVVDGGLKYQSFSRQKNINRNVTPPPANYYFYSGVDIGSGGKDAHPAAIAFIAVRSDFRYGRVFKGWRGDGEVTANSDILNKHTEMRGKLQITAQHYDWQAKDFFIIASRIGETFTPANKSHEDGESILNVLFKNGMLEIDDIPELRPLVTELTTLKKDTPKTKAKDDFTDAMRYGVTRIPWDFTAITGAPLDSPYSDGLTEEERQRRGFREEEELEDQLRAFSAEEELDGWDELMNSY